MVILAVCVVRSTQLVVEVVELVKVVEVVEVVEVEEAVCNIRVHNKGEEPQ